MGKMFNFKGKLNIPIKGKISIPKTKVDMKHGELIVKEAYCPKGHNLMSDVKINNQIGIHFIYTDQEGNKETEIVLSSFVGECRKKILKGKPFNKGEIIRILCPTCRTELPILFDCQCGAPIYLFYIDKRLDNQYGQSLCSRIGCAKASQLRFSRDALREFIQKHSF